MSDFSDDLRKLHEILSKLDTASSGPAVAGGLRTGRVFIVHGRADGLKEAVARLVERLGLTAIILSEQSNEGRTIIEKIELLSEVDFAIVLLSADDIGALRQKSSSPKYSVRARQNVHFELGFFTAKLGRNRIAVLHEEAVEIPSDLSGILYIRVDPDGLWRFKLAQELRTAGLNIDLNSIM